ncbi:hypothetical protein PagCFBP13505_022075 (plasmid) [Pantoea agglomerans]|uniref:hypothetical protein n=1 Tax=Enterobacter agglomerans TaxID=549 RepID=UPI0010C181DD|nr:hypothetical protein [Pantoea agglomerans]TKJ58369.1 hypothetical protein PagCFBP13505_07505 [Pantoea agglomerans]TKK30111.1 hypothetical protein PagCFBP13532_18265 [Pantoea agglomerans]
MAAINVKMNDELKEKGDVVLRLHELNATQYITLCWQYLAQHGRPPFMNETKVFTATDLIIILAGQFADVQSRLQAIKDMLCNGAFEPGNLAIQKQELTRLTGEILQNGWRLESLPEETGAVGAAYRALPRVNFHLSRCDFALSSMSALPVGNSEQAKFEMALTDFEEQYALLLTILRDASLLTRPEPVREFVYRGSNVTVSIAQPEDYSHGAWRVRLDTKSNAVENALEMVALPFPDVENRIFTAYSLYGAPIKNPHTQKFEIGFRFISGGCEFHMYSNGRPEEDNNNSLDKLASELSGIVDEYLKDVIAEMSERN